MISNQIISGLSQKKGLVGQTIITTLC